MGDRARSLTIDGVRLIKDLKVVELKAELERRGLSKSGSKKELVERLRSSVQFENTKSKATAAVNEEDVPNRWLQNEPNLDNNDYIREYFQSQKALYRQQIEVRRQYRETATATVGTSEVVSGSTTDSHQPSTPLPSGPQPTQVTEPKVSSKGNINPEVNHENHGLGIVTPTKANVIPISSCNITTSVASTISTITKSSATAVFLNTKKFITSKVAAFSATTKHPNPGYTAAPKVLEGFSNSASTTLTTSPQIIHPDSGREQNRLDGDDHAVFMQQEMEKGGVSHVGYGHQLGSKLCCSQGVMSSMMPLRMHTVDAGRVGAAGKGNTTVVCNSPVLSLITDVSALIRHAGRLCPPGITSTNIGTADSAAVLSSVPQVLTHPAPPQPPQPPSSPQPAPF